MLKSRISSNGVSRWEVGQKFVNMDLFRKHVRRYEVIDRITIEFVTNDCKRCQVCCKAQCPFYIWCSRDKDSEA